MSDLWHHGRQTKAEQPVTFSELRRLVRKGRLEGGDLVRKQGDPQWVAASTIPGLDARRRPRWYYTHWNKSLGPVTGTQLRQLAAAGMLEPTDLVWREGFDRWKRARRLAGLFPEAGADPTGSSTAKRREPRPPAGTGPSSNGRDPRARTREVNQPSPPATAALPRGNRHRLAASTGLLIILMVIASMAFRPGERAVAPTPDAASASPASGPEPETAPGPAPASAVADREPLAATPVIDSPPATATPTEDVGPQPGPCPAVAVRRPILPASPFLDRIKAAAGPLIEGRERTGPNVRFEVLDSDELDVFSLQDGTICVSRAVFQLVSDDVELAWLLGHEMAHAELRHGPTDPTAGHAPSADQEHAADEWATRRLLGLGHTRRQCLAFLRRYRSYLQTTSAAKPGHVAGSGTVDRHWNDRPTPSERISRLESLRPQLEPPTTASRGEGRTAPY
ncbi:GYF domain-containing protein [Aquisphaera insulae]|uniref:GYF domain-containing protein n=1 Tax=Aquisphaera insulae TaxID=2712864 RepID=UPI0013EDB461|nr:GYF domain-containing protein [Aquisphaera insulae]